MNISTSCFQSEQEWWRSPRLRCWHDTYHVIWEWMWLCSFVWICSNKPYRVYTCKCLVLEAATRWQAVSDVVNSCSYIMPTISGKGSPPEDAVTQGSRHSRILIPRPSWFWVKLGSLERVFKGSSYKRTLPDMSHGFTTALCLVQEPSSVFLTKTGESSSPAVQ